MTGIKGRRWGPNVYGDPGVDAGSIWYQDPATGLILPLPPGTAGDVLTSNGPGAAPSYQTPSGSGGGGGGWPGTIPTSGWTARNSPLWNDYLVPDRLGLYCVDSGAINWRALTQSLSGASTYTFIATLRGHWTETLSSQAFGLGLTDGTKYIWFEMLEQSTQSRLRVERLNSATSDNSTVAGPTGSLVASRLLTLKIVKDATHRTFSYWNAGAFTQFYQEANTAFLTETDVGFGGISVASNAGAGVYVELLKWSLA